MAFRKVVEASPYRDSIRILNTIHDALYLMVKNDIEVIKFVNDELIKAMLWQEDPMIASEEVKLGAELDIGKSWDKQYTLKNNASKDDIISFLEEHELYSTSSKES